MYKSNKTTSDKIIQYDPDFPLDTIVQKQNVATTCQNIHVVPCWSIVGVEKGL